MCIRDRTDKIKRNEKTKITKEPNLETIISKWKGFSGPILSSASRKIGKKNICNQIETWLEMI